MAARAPSYTLQAAGLAEVARAFKQSPRRLDKQLKKANKEAIEKALVPAVRAGAPKRSGRLAGSVRALATAQKAQLAVGSNVKVPYAGPINFGWPARNIASQEFIYAGINKSDSKTLEIYVEELDKVAKDIAPRGKL